MGWETVSHFSEGVALELYLQRAQSIAVIGWSHQIDLMDFFKMMT